MNRPLVIIAAASLLNGCGEGKVAAEYALKLSDILATYRRQIEVKIRAEQQSYLDLARAYDAAELNNRTQSLDIQRNQETSAFADEILHAAEQAPATTSVVFPSLILSRLQSYAESDFADAEKRLSREADAYKRALGSLEDLTVEQDHLEKLGTALATLAKPRSNLDQLKALAQFGCEINRNSRLLEVKREIGEFAQAAASAKAKRDAKTEEAKAATTEERRKALQEELKQLDNRIAAIGKQSAAATAEQTRLGTPCK